MNSANVVGRANGCTDVLKVCIRHGGAADMVALERVDRNLNATGQGNSPVQAKEEEGAAA
jgi:hypothetical protein